MRSPGEPPLTLGSSSSGAASPGEEILILGEKGPSGADPAAGVDGAADDDGFVVDGWLGGCDEGCEGVGAGDGVGCAGGWWRRWRRWTVE